MHLTHTVIALSSSLKIETDREVVYRIVNAALDAKDPTAIDPLLLTENDHILSKSLVYEEAIAELLNSCESPSSVAQLEAIDSVIRSFVISTRKARSKLKVTYLLAGASSSRLEEAVELLSSADEIDDHLLAYLDSLVQRRLGRSAKQEDEDSLPEAGSYVFFVSEFSPTYSLTHVGKVAVGVLQMIKRRLDAEMSLRSNDNLRLLAHLTAEPDSEVKSQYHHCCFTLH